eukprot:Gb_21784 [translate_table: standard]
MEKRPTTLLAGQEGAGMFTEPSADISKMQSVHPWDPHPPNSSHLLPESIRPYPSFEGWFFRIVDPQNAVSIGLIIGTNYATSQSQATILFCLPGGFSSTNYNTPEGHTHRIYVMTKITDKVFSGFSHGSGSWRSLLQLALSHCRTRFARRMNPVGEP